MEKHLYILYLCVIVLTGYIIYLRKYLLKVVVILNIQKKFYNNKGTQTLYNEDSSTDIVSDVPEPYINSHQEDRDICAASTLKKGIIKERKDTIEERKYGRGKIITNKFL